MNKKLILLIFIIGFILNLVGAFFKITHWQSGNIYLLSGLFLQFIAIILFLILFYTKQKNKNK